MECIDSSRELRCCIGRVYLKADEKMEMKMAKTRKRRRRREEHRRRNEMMVHVR